MADPDPVSDPTPKPKPNTAPDSGYSQEYVENLRTENASWRTKFRTAEQAIAEKEAALAAKDQEVTTKVTEVQSAADQRIVRAEMKAEALKAGIVDLDFLKLMDTSEIKIGADGEVVIPDKYFEKLKASKPHWFGAAASTSSTHKAPTEKNGEPKNARDMTPAERSSALRALGATKV
jgi:hypothetical protein